MTEAGSALFSRLSAATAQIDDAFTALTGFRDRPAGTLRLTAPRAFGALILKRLVPQFHRNFPDINFDISLDDEEVDLLEHGLDAGIRLGQTVAQDMVAVRLTGDLSWSVVATPAYLDHAGYPQVPEDLVVHQTLRYRFHNKRDFHRWHFVRDGNGLFVETGHSLVVNDTSLIADLVRANLGLAYLPDIEIAADLASGQFQRVLAPFVPSTSGLYLYFPAKSQSQPKLRAFIDMAAACVETLLSVDG